MVRRFSGALFLILIFTLPLHAQSTKETDVDPLIGAWHIASPVPPGALQRSVVFRDNGTMTIYDEKGYVLEKELVAGRTNQSFLGKILYASGQQQPQGELGAQRFLRYEIRGGNEIALSVYSDDAAQTPYLTFELTRLDKNGDSHSASRDSGSSVGGPQEPLLAAESVVDFDNVLPDREAFRNGARLDVVEDKTIEKTRMGMMELPEAPGSSGGRYSLPYASFQVDSDGVLRDTVTSFRAFIPGDEPYSKRAPYVVYAVTINDDRIPEAYVVGRRIVEPGGAAYPESEVPTGRWVECRMDQDTLVHVADFRENLGGDFTTWNYGMLGKLSEIPLHDERSWGDLRIVFVEIGAGAGPGPAFKAYVDDITIGSVVAHGTDTLASTVDAIWAQLSDTLDPHDDRKAVIAGFSASAAGPADLAAIVGRSVESRLAEFALLQVVGTDQAGPILDRAHMKLSDLDDIGQAVTFGRTGGFDLVVTGRIIQLSDRVLIFGRVVDVNAGGIASSAMVTVPRATSESWRERETMQER